MKENDEGRKREGMGRISGHSRVDKEQKRRIRIIVDYSGKRRMACVRIKGIRID